MRRERPTLIDVARRANVSKSTVSRVLNNDLYVGEETRQAVVKAMIELGYERNEVARSLRTQATMTVGLIVTGLRNEVFAAIADGVERVMWAADRMLLVASSDGKPELEQRAVQEFLRRGVDGLILSLVDERSQSIRRQLARADVPVVLLDRDAPGIAADRVLTDHSRGMRDAIADLQRHGHRSLGLLCPPQSVRAGREVYNVFTSMVDDDRFVRSGPLDTAFGYQAVQDLMKPRERPTALIVSGTQVLVGLLTGLAELSIRVPDNLSLVSYDDSAAARFYNPPISVLQRDTEEIGATAARLALERINAQRKQLRKILVPTQYVRRGSVAPPAADTADA